MTTIKQQLDECCREIWRLQRAIEECRLKEKALMQERHDCMHEFTPLIKGYEHEGGTCIHCGINEVAAVCNKIGAKYK